LTGPTATQSAFEVAILAPAALPRKSPENSPLTIALLRAREPETHLAPNISANVRSDGRQLQLAAACQFAATQ
jgi:hypothetical protein